MLQSVQHASLQNRRNTLGGTKIALGTVFDHLDHLAPAVLHLLIR
jgi:hypothetical protein